MGRGSHRQRVAVHRQPRLFLVAVPRSGSDNALRARVVGLSASTTRQNRLPLLPPVGIGSGGMGWLALLVGHSIKQSGGYIAANSWSAAVLQYEAPRRAILTYFRRQNYHKDRSNARNLRGCGINIRKNASRPCKKPCAVPWELMGTQAWYSISNENSAKTLPVNRYVVLLMSSKEQQPCPAEALPCLNSHTHRW